MISADAVVSFICPQTRQEDQKSEANFFINIIAVFLITSFSLAEIPLREAFHQSAMYLFQKQVSYI